MACGASQRTTLTLTSTPKAGMLTPLSATSSHTPETLHDSNGTRAGARRHRTSSTADASHEPDDEDRARVELKFVTSDGRRLQIDTGIVLVPVNRPGYCGDHRNSQQPAQNMQTARQQKFDTVQRPVVGFSKAACGY